MSAYKYKTEIYIQIYIRIRAVQLLKKTVAVILANLQNRSALVFLINNLIPNAF